MSFAAIDKPLSEIRTQITHHIDARFFQGQNSQEAAGSHGEMHYARSRKAFSAALEACTNGDSESARVELLRLEQEVQMGRKTVRDEQEERTQESRDRLAERYNHLYCLVLKNLGDISHSREEHPDASRYYGAAIEAGERSAVVYFRFARSATNCRQFGAAGLALEHCLAMNSNFLPALSLLQELRSKFSGPLEPPRKGSPVNEGSHVDAVDMRVPSDPQHAAKTGEDLCQALLAHCDHPNFLQPLCTILTGWENENESVGGVGDEGEKEADDSSRCQTSTVQDYKRVRAGYGAPEERKEPFYPILASELKPGDFVKANFAGGEDVWYIAQVVNVQSPQIRLKYLSDGIEEDALLPDPDILRVSEDERGILEAASENREESSETPEDEVPKHDDGEGNSDATQEETQSKDKPRRSTRKKTAAAVVGSSDFTDGSISLPGPQRAAKENDDALGFLKRACESTEDNESEPEAPNDCDSVEEVPAISSKTEKESDILAGGIDKEHTYLKAFDSTSRHREHPRTGTRGQHGSPGTELLKDANIRFGIALRNSFDEEEYANVFLALREIIRLFSEELGRSDGSSLSFSDSLAYRLGAVTDKCVAYFGMDALLGSSDLTFTMEECLLAAECLSGNPTYEERSIDFGTMVTLDRLLGNIWRELASRSAKELHVRECWVRYFFLTGSLFAAKGDNRGAADCLSFCLDALFGRRQFRSEEQEIEIQLSMPHFGQVGMLKAATIQLQKTRAELEGAFDDVQQRYKRVLGEHSGESGTVKEGFERIKEILDGFFSLQAECEPAKLSAVTYLLKDLYKCARKAHRTSTTGSLSTVLLSKAPKPGHTTAPFPPRPAQDLPHGCHEVDFSDRLDQKGRAYEKKLFEKSGADCDVSSARAEPRGQGTVPSTENRAIHGSKVMPVHSHHETQPKGAAAPKDLPGSPKNPASKRKRRRSHDSVQIPLVRILVHTLKATGHVEQSNQWVVLLLWHVAQDAETATDAFHMDALVQLFGFLSLSASDKWTLASGEPAEHLPIAPRSIDFYRQLVKCTGPSLFGHGTQKRLALIVVRAVKHLLKVRNPHALKELLESVIQPESPRLVRDATLASCVLGLFRISPLIADLWLLLCRAITTCIGLMSISEMESVLHDEVDVAKHGFGPWSFPGGLLRLAMARITVLGAFSTSKVAKEELAATARANLDTSKPIRRRVAICAATSLCSLAPNDIVAPEEACDCVDVIHSEMARFRDPCSRDRLGLSIGSKKKYEVGGLFLDSCVRWLCRIAEELDKEEAEEAFQQVLQCLRCLHNFLCTRAMTDHRSSPYMLEALPNAEVQEKAFKVALCGKTRVGLSHGRLLDLLHMVLPLAKKCRRKANLQCYTTFLRRLEFFRNGRLFLDVIPRDVGPAEGRAGSNQNGQYPMITRAQKVRDWLVDPFNWKSEFPDWFRLEFLNDSAIENRLQDGAAEADVSIRIATEGYQFLVGQIGGNSKPGAAVKGPSGAGSSEMQIEKELQSTISVCLFDAMVRPRNVFSWIQAGLEARKLLYFYSDRTAGDPYAQFNPRTVAVSKAHLNPVVTRSAHMAVQQYVAQANSALIDQAWKRHDRSMLGLLGAPLYAEASAKLIAQLVLPHRNGLVPSDDDVEGLPSSGKGAGGSSDTLLGAILRGVKKHNKLEICKRIRTTLHPLYLDACFNVTVKSLRVAVALLLETSQPPTASMSAISDNSGKVDEEALRATTSALVSVLLQVIQTSGGWARIFHGSGISVADTQWMVAGHHKDSAQLLPGSIRSFRKTLRMSSRRRSLLLSLTATALCGISQIGRLRTLQDLESDDDILIAECEKMADGCEGILAQMESTPSQAPKDAGHLCFLLYAVGKGVEKFNPSKFRVYLRLYRLAYRLSHRASGSDSSSHLPEKYQVLLFYRLHASRLKRVLEAVEENESGDMNEDEHDLNALATFSFDAKLSSWRNSFNSSCLSHRLTSSQYLTACIVNDALEALRYCRVADPYFHRSVYRIADAQVRLGRISWLRCLEQEQKASAPSSAAEKLPEKLNNWSSRQSLSTIEGMRFQVSAHQEDDIGEGIYVCVRTSFCRQRQDSVVWCRNERGGPLVEVSPAKLLLHMREVAESDELESLDANLSPMSGSRITNYLTMSNEILKEQTGPEASESDEEKQLRICLRLGTDAAAETFKAIFDKRRPQLAAVWIQETAESLCNGLDQRVGKYRHFHRKYAYAYADVLRRSLDVAALRRLLSWARRTPDQDLRLWSTSMFGVFILRALRDLARSMTKRLHHIFEAELAEGRCEWEALKGFLSDRFFLGEEKTLLNESELARSTSWPTGDVQSPLRKRTTWHVRLISAEVLPFIDRVVHAVKEATAPLKDVAVRDSNVETTKLYEEVIVQLVFLHQKLDCYDTAGINASFESVQRLQSFSNSLSYFQLRWKDSGKPALPKKSKLVRGRQQAESQQADSQPVEQPAKKARTLEQYEGFRQPSPQQSVPLGAKVGSEAMQKDAAPEPDTAGEKKNGE